MSVIEQMGATLLHNVFYLYLSIRRESSNLAKVLLQKVISPWFNSIFQMEQCRGVSLVECGSSEVCWGCPWIHLHWIV